MNTVSVIIPCYNCQEEIEPCIQAVLTGALLPAEIITVNDCSTDKTGETLSALARKHPETVHVVTMKTNGGPAKARNAGARKAKGDLLFFLDSDTEILPDALANFVSRVRESDAVVGIYDEEPINTGASPRYKALLYSYLLGQSGVQPYDQFSASCAGIRAEAFKAVGGYNEWFLPGLDFENEELGHRISRRFQMLLDPSIRARHIFPGFQKMTRTFFQRTALWVEMFVVRRRFSTLAGTSKTGLSSMALLVAVVMAPIGWLEGLWAFLALAPYTVFLYGYAGFWRFVYRRQPSFLPVAVLLTHYYTLVVACGAVQGLLRWLTGRSRIAGKFSASAGGGSAASV